MNRKWLIVFVVLLVALFASSWLLPRSQAQGLRGANGSASVPTLDAQPEPGAAVPKG